MADLSKLENVWTELYRPSSVKQCILPSNIRNMVEKYIAKKDVSNLLLVSVTPGSGKTSLAKAICKDLNADMKYVNVSRDRNIDALTQEVERFAKTKSMDGGQKIVILDELDGMLKPAQKAFRAMVEELAGNCRFIMTCNFINDIIDALKEEGRFKIVNMDYRSKEIREEMLPLVKERLIGILTIKNIKYDEETIDRIIKEFFPNIRGMLALLSKANDMYDRIDKRCLTLQIDDEELVDLILKKKITLARAYIEEKGFEPSEIYKALYEKLVPKLAKDKIIDAYEEISKAEYRTNSSAMPNYQVYNCIYQLIDKCL